METSLVTVALSLAMIVKDEAAVLGRVLEQARTFCDELVIVDTGSSDGTVALAESFGAKVFQFDWIDDFAAARNFAFSCCTGDWIIWLDADDVVPEKSQRQLLALKQQALNESLDAVICSYQIAFTSQGDCTLSMPRERLIRRGAGGQWEFPIHEAYVLPDEERCLERLDIVVRHDKPAIYTERSSDRNLNMLAALIAKGDETPRLWYYYGKELEHHDRPEEALQAYIRFLTLEPDNRITRYQALHHGMTCLMMLDRHAEALEWGFRALALDSSRAEVLTELGVIYYREACYAQAIPLLTAATAGLRPAAGLILEENYTWRPYHYLSLCYEGVGAYGQAIEAALKALPLIPDKPVVAENIRCFAAKIPD